MGRLLFCGVCVVIALILLENGALAKKKRTPDVTWYKLRNGTDCGVRAQMGDKVSMHWYSYIELNRSATYDSTFPFGPVEFRLGRDRHITGFEKGVVGMCEGEERVIFIPCEVAFPSDVEPPTVGRLKKAWPIMRLVNANFTFEAVLKKVLKPTWRDKMLTGVYIFAPFSVGAAIIGYLLLKVARAPEGKKVLKEQRLRKKGQGKKKKN